MAKVYLNEGDEAIMTINGKEITVGKLTVSPTRANEIISSSDAIFQNRKSREASYRLYCKDMSNGEWKTNGETIKFGKNGELLDGRNRISAVAIGDKDIEFLYVGNVDKDTIDTIDIGIKRSLEHVLKIQGISYEVGSAAIVKQKLTLDKKRFTIGASEASFRLSRLDSVHEYESKSEKYTAATTFGKEINNLSHKVLNRLEVGAILMHLTDTFEFNEDFVKDFFYKLSNPTKPSIFWTTYENLRQKGCRGKDRIKEFIICWNSYISGKKTKRSAFDDEMWFNGIEE